MAAFYTACSTFMGQNWGAGNRDRMIDALRCHFAADDEKQIEQDIQNAHVQSYTLSFNGMKYEVAVHKVSNRRRPQ